MRLASCEYCEKLYPEDELENVKELGQDVCHSCLEEMNARFYELVD